jgi:signal transduction histidine kinase
VRIALVREPDGLRLRIADDGVGLTDEALAKPKSHGVVGMRERMREMGGKFAIRRPASGRGTVVEAFIPNPGKETAWSAA